MDNTEASIFRLSPSPKISVMMITYNHEKFVGQAIESVLMQTAHSDLEIVVGEDCSTDGTRAILAEYQKKYPDKIRLLLPQNNLGMLRNLIQTLEACRGEYIAFLEGDDYWTDRWKLSRQIEFLDAHPDCVLCGHQVRKHFENETRPDVLLPALDPPEISDFNELLVANYVPTCSVMIRARALPTIPEWFYSLKMGDWPLFILISEHGSVGFISKVMGTYRVHDGGVWSSKSWGQQVDGVLRMYQQLQLHFNAKYDSIIIPRIYFWYAQSAIAYCQRGNYKQGRLVAISCFRYAMRHRYLLRRGGIRFRDFFKLFLKVFMYKGYIFARSFFVE